MWLRSKYSLIISFLGRFVIPSVSVSFREVLQSFNGISSVYARWQELLNSTNTTSNEEFKFTMNELKNGIKSIEWDLTDLEETISIVESNKSKFKIDDNELRSRKGFISDIRKKTNAMKDDLNSAKTKGVLERDQREVIQFINYFSIYLVPIAVEPNIARAIIEALLRAVSRVLCSFYNQNQYQYRYQLFIVLLSTYSSSPPFSIVADETEEWNRG